MFPGLGKERTWCVACEVETALEKPLDTVYVAVEVHGCVGMVDGNHLGKIDEDWGEDEGCGFWGIEGGCGGGSGILGL